MTAAEPYAIEIPDEVLDDLHRRLDATRWFDALPGAGWDEGTDLDYLKELCPYWRCDYDWRAVEAQLNGFPQYTTTIDSQRLHFVHARCRNPGTMALVIHHGWPGSIDVHLQGGHSPNLARLSSHHSQPESGGHCHLT